MSLVVAVGVSYQQSGIDSNDKKLPDGASISLQTSLRGDEWQLLHPQLKKNGIRMWRLCFS
jgi:hypothetical protein